jgi:hypothetical protein
MRWRSEVRRDEDATWEVLVDCGCSSASADVSPVTEKMLHSPPVGLDTSAFFTGDQRLPQSEICVPTISARYDERQNIRTLTPAAMWSRRLGTGRPCVGSAVRRLDIKE